MLVESNGVTSHPAAPAPALDRLLRLPLPTLPADLQHHSGGAQAQANEAGLAQALQRSRRVGELLLKTEEAELEAVAERAGELTAQHA